MVQPLAAVRPGVLAGTGLALVGVCYGLARFGYGLFVPEFRDAFALNGALLGGVAAGSYVGYCAAVLVAGAAVARFGPRAVAVAAGLVAAAGMGLVAASGSGTALAVGVVVAGTSTGLASPPTAAAIARWTPAAFQDRGQALVNAGTGAGIAVSGPVALLASGHWRLAWACFAVIALVVTVRVARVVPAGGPTGRPGAGAPRGLAGVVRDRRSVPMVVASALFGAAGSAVWTFGRDHVVASGGWGEELSTLLWVVLGVAGLAGVAAAALVTRIGPARAWSTGLAALALATAALGVLPGAAGVPFAAIAVFGAAYVVVTTLVLFWAIRLHPDRTAAAVAVGFVAIAAGQAAATPLVGLLADHAGLGAAFLACAALALATAAMRPRRDGAR